LLTEHLTLAADLVNAVKAGNSQKAREIEERWYANGDEIAEFLGSINPFWSVAEWKRLFRLHLDLVKQEAVDLINEDYEGSIETYDRAEQEALMMADVLTQGIIRQFQII